MNSEENKMESNQAIRMPAPRDGAVSGDWNG